MKEIILAVEGLTVYRGNRAILENISFSLEAGTDTAIIGPNGAGKTTLVQALLGILPRQSGCISLLGKPGRSQGGLARYCQEKVAYLPQNFLFDRRIPITVEELVGLGWDKLTLELPWANYRQRGLAVREALARVEATHLRGHLVSALSGGEAKRVLLAYCLVRPRRLLILDEAAAGLDICAETEFYQLLAQMKREQGWTILQISHDLAMVRRYCDRVLCLNRTLIYQGVPEMTLTPDNLVFAYNHFY